MMLGERRGTLVEGISGDKNGSLILFALRCAGGNRLQG